MIRLTEQEKDILREVTVTVEKLAGFAKTHYEVFAPLKDVCKETSITSQSNENVGW